MTEHSCRRNQATLRASHAEIQFLHSRRSFRHLNYSSRPLMAEMSQERTATDKHHFSTIPTAIVHGPLLHAQPFAVITADIPPVHFDILHERSSLSPLI